VLGRARGRERGLGILTSFGKRPSEFLSALAAEHPRALARAPPAPLAAEPGDLLVHHARTVHRADGNRSADRHRRALGLVYCSARAREDVAAHAEYQRALAERMRAEGRI